MKVCNYIVIVFGLILVPVRAGFAATGYGTAGAQILNLNTSARIMAMGNANAGLADDLNAVIYNPAGLSNLFGTELDFTRVVYFLDTSLNAFGWGQKIGKMGIGFKMKTFAAEDLYRNSIGYLEEKFNIKYSQYTFGLGLPVSQNQSIGVSSNMVSENFELGSISEYGEDKKGSTIAFDVGWYYRARRGDSFGFVIRNVGSAITIDEDEDKLPFKVVLGGAHRVGKLIFSWESFTGKETDFAWQSGIETNFSIIKIRAGLIYITKADITLGFGLPYSNFRLDYAFLPHQDIGVAHRISVGAEF